MSALGHFVVLESTHHLNSMAWIMIFVEGFIIYAG